ncbi:hypothetical protein MMC07_009491 [Pseudocyphellaria aurata]|nr:hypothetical protein [Pseudocyphellaria aurata]
MSTSTGNPSLPSGQIYSPSPLHGGNTDPNEIRRRAQYNQTIPSQPSTPSIHGGNTDPNQIRMQLASSQSSSPAPSHGGNADPNEIRQRLGQSQSATPLLQDQSGTFSTQRVVSPQESILQYPTPSTPPYGGNMNSTVPTHQTPSQAQSGYFQGSQITQALGGAQVQYPQNGNAAPLPQGNYGNPIPQTPSPSFSMPSHGAPNQQPNAYGGQPSQISQGHPPQGNVYGPMNNQTLGGHYSPSQPSQITHPPGPFQREVERGYGNLLISRQSRRWKFPNFYQVAGIYRAPHEKRHHRDMMSRRKHFVAEDYYLSPFDCHLAKLVVQSAQEVYDAKPNSTWRRTFIRNMSPYMLRVANWVLDTVPHDDREMTAEEIFLLVVKWVPASAMLLILMTYPTSVIGEVRNGGKYDPFYYTYWGYPYHTRNAKEARPPLEAKPLLSHTFGSSASNSKGAELTSTNPISKRPIEPKYLCFLKEGEGVDICDVETWKREHGKAANYVLVSYTSEQFQGDEQELFLHDVGEHAARAAGVPAYWVGCACLGDKSQVEENVWRISDIIRGAHSMAIVLSDPGTSRESSMDTLLERWGTRVWTLPEVLLSPSHEPMVVYVRGQSIDAPTRIHKRHMAAKLEDKELSRQLIEHFEGSLILGHLELVTIALRCLHGRQKGKHLEGDMSYALMGLLRQRPTVVRQDTAFQAFARLSLANDSNMLLERLICVLPKRANQPWHDMDDEWDVALWDIYPTTQICGIGDNDTVILDNAHAASIRWKAFTHVLTFVNSSWRRTFTRYAFRSSSYVFYLGIAFVTVGKAGNGAGNHAYTALGAILLVIGSIFTLLSPYLIRLLYTGKSRGAQPWFFGFEGYLDLPTIERHIYGANLGYLSWSTNGSPLSRHQSNEYGECEGLDPTTDPNTAARVKRAVNSAMGEEKIFTLVDTNTQTVTMFAAVRPPVAVVLCGQEGGMQRALLCSYEWTTQTLYRETVVRMETPVLESMSRLGRFRFGMDRPAEAYRNT